MLVLIIKDIKINETKIGKNSIFEHFRCKRQNGDIGDRSITYPVTNTVTLSLRFKILFQKMTEAAVTAICAEINEALAACVAANVSQNKPFIVYSICPILYVL